MVDIENTLRIIKDLGSWCRANPVWTGFPLQGLGEDLDKLDGLIELSCDQVRLKDIQETIAMITIIVRAGVAPNIYIYMHICKFLCMLISYINITVYIYLYVYTYIPYVFYVVYT